MTPFDHSDRLRRFSEAMAMLTMLGMLLIAIAMVLVFLIPDWTRNLLLARLGQAGHDLRAAGEFEQFAMDVEQAVFGSLHQQQPFGQSTAAGAPLWGIGPTTFATQPSQVATQPSQVM